MGIRIQPKPIRVCACDPFKYDLLNREETIQVFTDYIGSIEGGGVIALDAPWGFGKTTFLNLWSTFTQRLGINVVKFNAWETDFSGEPFVALASELTTALDAANNGGIDVSDLS